MIDNDRVESLLQEELDGVLRDADRDELNALIASDPRVADEQRQLHQLADALARLPLTAAPPGFADDIMARLPPPAAPATRSRNAPRGKPRWPALALAAGVGALAVGLGLGLSRESGLSPDELGGTLLVEPVSEAQTGTLLFTEGLLTGTIRAEETDTSVFLHVDLQAADAAQITVSTRADTLDRRVTPGTIQETWKINGDLASGVQVTVVAAGEVRSEHLIVPTGAVPAAQR